MNSDGIWCDVRKTGSPSGRPALFLDRDGTLIELVDYLADPEQVVLISETVAAIRRAKKAGWAVIIVTNQSGIGRGYYGWDEFSAVQTRVHNLLTAHGTLVDAVYACPHPPPSAGGPPVSAYRKPAPGMLLRAAADLRLDLSRSVIAGDTAADLMAGKSAGLLSGALTNTGYGGCESEREKAKSLSGDGFTVTFELGGLF